MVSTASQTENSEQKSENTKEAAENIDLIPLPPLRLSPSLPNTRSVSITPNYTSRSVPVWYLGIDFGKTGISAALLDRSLGKIYPIAWSTNSTEVNFRLPAVVDRGKIQKNFKPYLKISLPYFGTETGNDQPELQWANQPENESAALSHPTSQSKMTKVSLREVISAVQILLNNLKSQNAQLGSKSDGGNYCFAEGISAENFALALANLGGAIVSCPAQWPESYRFNLRESILATGVVNNPEQICFLEESIASVLAELYSNSANSINAPSNNNENAEYSRLNRRLISHSATRIRGATLAIHSGATTTELALADIPENLEELTYSDFYLRSFPYAGSYIDQDIICQLLLDRAIATLPIKDLELPLPGEPDLSTRYQFQIRLESSPLGQTFLAAAQHLKVILQHEESFNLNIGTYQWLVKRQDLENRVYSRFIQSLNRELNTLLAMQGISVEAIEQVLCTGGTGMMESLTNWLRHKLPNAKIIQEPEEPQIPRIALGLAALPLYPQVFDDSRQQYNDYFLLLELLRTFGEQPLSVGKIIQLLERKGINTRACQQRLFALLEGDLPPGLIPGELETILLTPESRQNPDYLGWRGGKLFSQEADRSYRLNVEYADRLRRYLTAVLAQTRQKLEDPYGVYWLTSTRN